MTQPAPTIVPSAASQPASPWSCHSCRRRKTRCDRRDPCTPCLRAGLDCGFPSTGKLPTRRHDFAEQPRNHRERHTHLLGRLTHLETLVDELSAQVQADKGRQDDSTAQNDAHNKQRKEQTEAEAIFPQHIGRLVNDGNGKAYMGNRIWTLIYSQLESIREAAVDDFEQDQWPGDDASQPLPWALPFLWSNPGFDASVLRPLPSQISYLWDIFLERMDPFIKILHVPSMTGIIRQTVSQPGRYQTEPGTEALIVAISLAAVTSLAENEVMSAFGETKTDLLSRLTVATEQALSQANVLNTSDMSVIRAFLVYLESMAVTRGTRAIWSLNGLLIRAAQSVGLHRDSTHFSDISPFESEMRRRLWWHICFLDARVSGCQVSEVSLTEEMFDTLAPSNLDDKDIHPEMTSLPDVKGYFTDSSLCIIRSDLWRLLRRIQSSMSTLPPTLTDKPSREQLLQEIRDARERVKRACLTHSDTEPNYVFAEKLAELDLQSMEICVRCHCLSRDQATGNTAPKSPRDDCFLAAITGCESIRALLDDVSTRKWAWVFQESVFWPSLSGVLMELCTRPWNSTCERAWVLAEQNSRHLVRAREKGEVFYAPLANLLSAARRHREEELNRLGMQTGGPLAQDSGEWQSRLAVPSVLHAFIDNVDKPPTLSVSSAEDGLAMETAQSIEGCFLDAVRPTETYSSGISEMDAVVWDTMRNTALGIGPMCNMLESQARR
ncbi:fungal-specific transcription factor domain-containing protein [Lipomyces tetrasporus]|uniref:Fungal-specific transcription factor domain-containing protein n=1 Tax=Lipomyces tetrasporus TaxID=54092 RepID=A0AAD7VRI4_9ASCO|nr:fungal-specific transcription factor domain-containing protein [Lipomyces tetrasporus]KAJ8098951.1 fungal-specific transcription factor domain-containing protein [Lipomyces tetrasporus]